MTNYGIVYASGSKMIRRIITSDDPAYDYSIHAGPGESALVANKQDGSDIFAARAAVEVATGEKPKDIRAAVVDENGLVVNVLLADPDIDVVDGHELVKAYAPEVGVDCTYDKVSGIFTAPIKVIPEYTMPAYVDEDGLAHPEEVVPERIEGGPIAKPAADEILVP